MGMECCAYSFLLEDSHMCDYEIATDELASYISVTRHYVKHIDQKDLCTLIELVYHANGSIRGKCAIHEEEVQQLYALYQRYHVEMKHFVIPDGCIGASYLHVLRSKTKAVIRYMTCIKKEALDVPKSLWDFMNLLANTFFMMALYENQKEGFSEKEFVSKSYES